MRTVAEAEAETEAEAEAEAMEAVSKSTFINLRSTKQRTPHPQSHAFGQEHPRCITQYRTTDRQTDTIILSTSS